DTAAFSAEPSFTDQKKHQNRCTSANIISLFATSFSTTMGATTTVRPSTKVILIMLLPTTLPATISPLPSSAAIILTTASGALVPNAIMVKPIIIGEILNFLAIVEALSTNQSAPFISSTNPATS